MAVHVSMQNTSTNTINQVRITSTSSVFEGTAAGSAPAPYDSVVSSGGVGATCSATTSGSVTTVSCSVGQMKGGDTSDFFVIYKSPLFATPPTSPTVALSVVATFSEGGSPSSPPANFPKDPVSATLTLVTTDTPSVNSSILTLLPDAGTFFTGATPNGVDSTNQFSTSVGVPSTKTTASGKQTVTNNSIAETFAGSTFACAPNIDASYFCYGLSSAIEVLDAATGGKLYLDGTLAGPQITIVLTQDASSLAAKKPVPKIGDIKIFYTYPNPDPNGTPATFTNQVPDCGSSGPLRNAPCISGRLDALKGSKGYYQWTINALDNGNFSW